MDNPGILNVSLYAQNSFVRFICEYFWTKWLTAVCWAGAMCGKKATSNGALDSLPTRVTVLTKFGYDLLHFIITLSWNQSKAQPRGFFFQSFSVSQKYVLGWINYFFVLFCFFLISWPRFVKLSDFWRQNYCEELGLALNSDSRLKTQYKNWHR